MLNSFNSIIYDIAESTGGNNNNIAQNNKANFKYISRHNSATIKMLVLG